MADILIPPALLIAVRMLPPTVNHMYVARRQGGKALSDEARAFRELAALSARGAAQRCGWHYPPGARLELTISLTFPNRINQDIDNRVKAALDALALALGFNDSCVDRIVIGRAGTIRNQPLCEMMLRIMETA